MARPTAADHTDACLDRSGLVLEELMVKVGTAVQRLTATEIADSATLDPASLNADGNPVGFDQGGATFTPLDTVALPTSTYRSLPTAPEGFDYRGRFTLQTADQSTPPTTVAGAGAPPVAGGTPGRRRNVAMAQAVAPPPKRRRFAR